MNKYIIIRDWLYYQWNGSWTNEEVKAKSWSKLQSITQSWDVWYNCRWSDIVSVDCNVVFSNHKIVLCE